MAAFTKGLKNNKNEELVRSLYLNPPENFDVAMSRANDNMLADEALDSSEEEEQALRTKQHKKAKRGKPSSKQPAASRSPPPPSRHYTLLDCPRSEIPNYLKEEGCTTQPPPPMKAQLATRQNKDMYCRYHQDYRHDTMNCYNLKEEIERLISRGHLKCFFDSNLPREEREKGKQKEEPRKSKNHITKSKTSKLG